MTAESLPNACGVGGHRPPLHQKKQCFRFPVYAIRFPISKMSPARMEPAGAARHGRSPQGERAGASESIEPALGTTKQFSRQRERYGLSPAGIEPTFKV